MRTCTAWTFLGLDVDTKLAGAIGAQAVREFNEAVKKFEALHRALDIVVQAIDEKGGYHKQKAR